MNASKSFVSLLKVFILTLPITLFSIICSGQKFGVKVYQNTDLLKTNTSYGQPSTEAWAINFNRFSFAIDIHAAKGVTHEIEVFIPENSKKLGDVKFPYGYRVGRSISAANRESNFAVRYEVSKKITKGSGPFAIRLGVAVNPYYLKIEYIPQTENTYYTSLKDYAFSINFVPGFTYAINKHFQLSLNIPLKVYDFRYEVKNILNPAIPIRQQESKSYDNTFFQNAFTMRLGVAFVFGR